RSFYRPAWNYSVVESVVDALASTVGVGVRWLEWIVDDDQIAPSASQRSVDRRCKAISPLGGSDLGFGIFSSRDSSAWEHTLVPGGRDGRAAASGPIDG